MNQTQNFEFIKQGPRIVAKLFLLCLAVNTFELECPAQSNAHNFAPQSYAKPALDDAAFTRETARPQTTGPANSTGAAFQAITGWLSEKTGQLFGNSTQPNSGPDVKRILASLALVLGGYFALVWLLRMIAPAANSSLPNDVIEILGKTPFGQRQHLQLVRLGNKLLLLLESPEGIQPIAEVTDFHEVEHLLNLCNPKSKKRRQIKPAAQTGLNPANYQVHSLRIPAVADQAPTNRLSADAGNISLSDLIRVIENSNRPTTPNYKTTYEA